MTVKKCHSIPFSSYKQKKIRVISLLLFYWLREKNVPKNFKSINLTNKHVKIESQAGWVQNDGLRLCHEYIFFSNFPKKPMEQESDTSFSLKNDAETNTIPPRNMQSRV